MTSAAPSITVPTSQGAARWPGAAESGRVRVELLVVASVALGAAGQLMLKASLLFLASHGAGMNVAGDPQLKAVAGILFGLCVYAIGTLFWIKAVSRASISYLYPLSAGSYALVAIGGHVLFSEMVHPWRWAGIAVTTVGVALMADRKSTRLNSSH